MADVTDVRMSGSKWSVSVKFVDHGASMKYDLPDDDDYILPFVPGQASHITRAQMLIGRTVRRENSDGEVWEGTVAGYAPIEDHIVCELA